MNALDLRPGAKVDIRAVADAANRGRTEDHNYVSSIYDILEDGTIQLDIPMRAGKMVLIPMGLRYEMVFTMEGKLYRAHAHMLRRIRQGRFSVLEAELVTEVEKFQRREYYRLDCNLPLNYIVLDDNAGDLQHMADIRSSIGKDPKTGDGLITNISGGGCKFTSSDELLEDTKYLFIRFSLDSDEQQRMIALIAEIVGIERIKNNLYSYRVRLHYKDSRCQEIIIRYIFDQERKLRKKRLGV